MTDFPVTNLKKDTPFCSTRIELKIKTTGKADCGKIETTWNMFETLKSGNCYSSQEDEQC